MEFFSTRTPTLESEAGQGSNFNFTARLIGIGRRLDTPPPTPPDVRVRTRRFAQFATVPLRSTRGF